MSIYNIMAFIAKYVRWSLFRNKEIIIRMILILVIIQNDVCDGYQMEDYCNNELSLTDREHQVRLVLDDHDIYGLRRKKKFLYGFIYDVCETKIEAWYITFPKLMFYFEDLNLLCVDGHLEFYQGETGSTRVSGLEGDICGNNKPVAVYAVDTKYIRIRYIPTRNHLRINVFTIIITAFADENCPSFAHECKNSRCIDKELVCNGYDSCGDGSGCVLSTSVIFGIVLGSLAGLAFIVSVIVCCICRRRKTGIVQSAGQTRVEHSSSDQGFSQASYGVKQAAPDPAYQTQELSSVANPAPLIQYI